MVNVDLGRRADRLPLLALLDGPPRRRRRQ
jgi:hypothetical protein